MTDHEGITLEQVRHVAALARLTLSEAETAGLAQDLGKILDHVRKLDELDTTDVPATAHAVPLPTALRPDTLGPGLAVDKGLAGAPERLGDGFGVPKILE